MYSIRSIFRLRSKASYKEIFKDHNLLTLSCVAYKLYFKQLSLPKKIQNILKLTQQTQKLIIFDPQVL